MAKKFGKGNNKYTIGNIFLETFSYQTNIGLLL